MAVAFKELDGSPTEHFGADGIGAVREVTCAWADRHTLMEELLGDGYTFGGGTRAGYPGFSGLVATTVDIKPFHPRSNADQDAFSDITTELNSYSQQGQMAALLTIKYALLLSDLYGVQPQHPNQPDVEDGTFLTYHAGHRMSKQKIEVAPMTWESDGAQVTDPQAGAWVEIPEIEHNFTWHRVTRPPYSVIRALIGHVNRNLFMGAPAETVLFASVQDQAEFTSFSGLGQGLWAHKMSYIFVERSIKNFRIFYDPLAPPPPIVGWNHTYRSKPLLKDGWDRIKNAHGYYSYPGADFTPLFRYQSAG